MENRMPHLTEAQKQKSGGEEVTAILTLATCVKVATCFLPFVQVLYPLPKTWPYPISNTSPNQCLLFPSRPKKLKLINIMV